MRRRQALRSLISLPAWTAMPALAQQAPTDKTKPPAQEKAPAEVKPPAPEESPKLAVSAADAVAHPEPHFFSPLETQTLRRLAAILIPAANGKPGAVEAGVPEFLDFLIAQSPADRQTLYRQGLGELEQAAQREFKTGFAELSPPQAGKILAPLREAWTFTGPVRALDRFLATAKEDTLHATLNSREWAATSTGRRGRGLGTYWYPVE